MGRRGPPPAPDWLKILKGNPGKRKIVSQSQEVVPGQQLVEAMDPPPHYNPEQRQIWNQVCEILRRVNALSFGDRLPLERYVELLYLYRRASLFMQDKTAGQVVYPIKDAKGVVRSMRMLPQLKVMLEISNHLLRIEQHFGLTPSSRAAMLSLNNGPEPVFDIDPFA